MNAFSARARRLRRFIARKNFGNRMPSRFRTVKRRKRRAPAAPVSLRMAVMLSFMIYRFSIPAQSLGGNIAPKLRAVESNFIYRRVGGYARAREVFRPSCNAEDTPAMRCDAAG